MKTENGMVIGAVSTDRFKSKREFEICDEETWNSLTETERDRRAIEAMFDSGVIDTSW